MTKRMLIDAAHPEETRVVIVDGSRVEELDFESRHKRQLRGNVYLAKVTRVEPSLQAAFIDYGGNRHGFLAFSEIHPDYYQIPYEDKLALQQQEEEDLADESDDDDVEEDENLDPDENDASDENDAEVADEQVKVASKRRKQIRRRRYKIQEVIKRGQVLLVQAVKEERGNKGAAMTTYLSMAGRYCVLMPNTPRGGGISRKISNGSDRKRLKSIMDSLDVPQGMGVIVRTAGAKRTKAEITRDYNYLSRLWDDVRDTTLKSVAPALIHEEGNLVKRSIRDLYNKEIEEVLVQGEDAYKTAKGFIKMLMPSHSKFVKRYDDEIPLFLRFDVERQIENSLDATVQLKSGGYLVIHPTEALVSVDVNSGKSTKERNVERTALKTNLEAAEELARQMRLRDLAGLIVVDFIDMDDNKNNRSVERKMKDVLSRDRARIQTSRISQFGLMEISRQRRRRSLLEGSTAVCTHCDGVGRKRTVESSALAAIRAVEEFAIRGKAKKIRLKCPPDVALYLLNEKRDLLTKVDEDADVFTVVEHDDDLIRPSFVIEVAEKRNDGRKDPLVQIEKELREETKKSEQERKSKTSKAEDADDKDNSDSNPEAVSPASQDDDDDSKPRRRRGRRGGRNRKRRGTEPDGSDQDNVQSESENTSDDTPEKTDDLSDKKTSKPSNNRRRKAPSKNAESQTSDSTETDPQTNDSKDEDDKIPAPKKRRSRSRRKAPTRSGSSNSASDSSIKTETVTEPKDEAKPARRRKAPSRDQASNSEEKKPTRRRKAPSKAKAKTGTESETQDQTPDTPVKSETSVKAKAQPKRRRAAPKRTSNKDDAPEETSTRRRAPTKTKAEKTPDDKSSTSKTEDAPKRRRKAPAKGQAKGQAKPSEKASEKPSGSSDDKPADTPKPRQRRKAPAKAPAKVKAEGSAKAENAPKPARKRAATKKKTTAEQTESETASAKSAPVKPKRKAPANKSSAKVSGQSLDEGQAQPARRRKAPARQSAPEPKADAPKSEPKPVAEPTQDAETSSDDRRRKAPPRRKRGLLDRLMGKE